MFFDGAMIPFPQNVWKVIFHKAQKVKKKTEKKRELINTFFLHRASNECYSMAKQQAL